MNSLFVLILVVASNGAERQPVATNQSAATRPSANHTQVGAAIATMPANLIMKAFDGIATLSNEAAKVITLVKSKIDRKDIAEPTLVWVHLSKQFLSNYVERNVERTKPVRDLILGTTINGESYTTGKTRLVLHPTERGALATLSLLARYTGKQSAN